MALIDCPECGHKVDDQADACPSCGRRLTDRQGMNAKKKAVLDRIKHLEEAITKAHEYLETGKHAHWHRFRAWFAVKVRDGKALPPHRDWVKNVFLPRRERALKKAQKALEKLA